MVPRRVHRGIVNYGYMGQSVRAACGDPDATRRTQIGGMKNRGSKFFIRGLFSIRSSTILFLYRPIVRKLSRRTLTPEL